ncbi:MAG: ABC transporter ATP-binding protein [Elusimicrobia bacterium]|nr:ABC transporter ATP-binding protein [Elusimicrobiota bacterium]
MKLIQFCVDSLAWILDKTFAPGSRPLILRLSPYLLPHSRRLLLAGLSMVAVALLKGATIYLLKPVVDNASLLKDEKYLLFIVALVPAIFLLKTLVQYSQAYLMSWTGQRVVQQMRENLFRHLHALSAEFYWNRRSGDIMSRVTNDLNAVQSALQFTPLYMVRDSLTLVTLLGALFYTNWRFTLFALIAGPLAAFLLGSLGKRMKKSAGRSQAIVGHIYHIFQESLEGMVIVKAFNYEKGAIDRFCSQNDALFVQMMRYLRVTALSGPLMEFLGSLVAAMLVYFGGREIIAGRMTPGEFSVFMGAFFMAYEPLKNIANMNATIQLGLVSWGRISQLLDEKPSVVEPANPVRMEALKGHITFQNVSYQYPSGQKKAVNGIDIEVLPGQAVAFVGLSGSGKTTLINLLLRLFDPTEGRVLYDGHDLRELELKSLRTHIGLVSQNTVLFDDTVAGNIALGMPEASSEAIEEACKVADAHEFIMTLPQGYQTMLGERGVKLSGGQRQRLAIARAILKKPSVLILDEATSNLDSSSEKAVQASIEKLLSGRTVVMVAHRLSTIRNADRIYVLHNGEISEQGTHESLLQGSGIYKRLHEMQVSHG